MNEPSSKIHHLFFLLLFIFYNNFDNDKTRTNSLLIVLISFIELVIITKVLEIRGSDELSLLQRRILSLSQCSLHLMLY